MGTADPAQSSDLCRNAGYQEDSLFILLLVDHPQFGDINYLHKLSSPRLNSSYFVLFSDLTKEHRRFFFPVLWWPFSILKSSLSFRGDRLTTTSGLDDLDNQLTSSAFRQMEGAHPEAEWSLGLQVSSRVLIRQHHEKSFQKEPSFCGGRSCPLTKLK